MRKVFISYSHSDQNFVRRLRRHLEERHISVWQDERELRVGDSVMRKIRSGIDTSDYFILVISEASIKSEWVQRELDVAMTHEIETGKRTVLPALIGDVDAPAFTKGKFYADFTKSYRRGLTALLKAIEVRPAERNIVVSVLIRSRGILRLCNFLLENQNFERIDSLPPLVLSLEIAGGYFAFMRRDKESSVSRPSVFQPLPVLELHAGYPTLKRNEVFVAFGPWQDLKFKDRGLTTFKDGFFVVPEWRNVLYIFGSEVDVNSAIGSIMSFNDLQSGARIDLEIALSWWAEPTVISNAPRVHMEPRYVETEVW